MLNNNSPQMPPVSPVGSAPISSAGAYAAPPVAPVKVRSGDSSLLKIIIIILLSLRLIGALLLAYYFYIEYNATRSDVDAQIEAAVLDANKVLEDELQAKFAEEEKNPYRTFTGPSDYGSLSFKYPKTWSVYVEKMPRRVVISKPTSTPKRSTLYQTSQLTPSLSTLLPSLMKKLPKNTQDN